MPAQLAPGRIICADNVLDPAGRNPKRRRFVVLEHEVGASGEITVVGVFVTGTFLKPPPKDHIKLPWSPDGRAQTRLTKESYAVCSHPYIYHLTFASEDEIEFRGSVDGRTLDQITAKIEELNQQQGGDAGQQENSPEPGP